jgi:uncharacterized membrane protein
MAVMSLGVAPFVYSTTDYFSITGGNTIYANLNASENFVDIYTNTAISFVASAQGATNFNWDFGDGTTVNNGPANILHTYTVAGNYTVAFAATNGICSDTVTTAIEVINTTGTANLENLNTKVICDGDKIAINFGQLHGIGTIEVYNLIGERIYLQEQVNLTGNKLLNLAHASVGQYLLKISSKEQVYSCKINISR